MAQSDTEEPKFSIDGFLIEGNSLLPEEDIQDALERLTGRNRGATDVETARNSLEQLYHRKGYPTVLVNIPQQTVTEGIITLEVIEGRIERVNITGNRYYTMDRIRESLPALTPGEVLYAPAAQKEITKFNENPDIKVAPTIIPGKVPGAVDVQLKVEDRSPLHGSVEISNRGSPDTTDLRANVAINYANLWQRDHSVSLQYQTSPEDLDEVQVVSATYALPVPWNVDHHLAVYGIWSNGNTAFGEGFRTIGKGSVFGLRYVMPLPPYKQYAHNLVLGLDYKDFSEIDPTDASTSVTYFPLSIAYTSVLPDSIGATQFTASLNMSFRGFVTDPSEFAAKRFEGKGNYLYGLAGVERTQDLPGGLKLHVRVGGQVASEPLISNEQYSAGGMESVRAYKETEAQGDNAVGGTIELRGFEVFEKYGTGGGRIRLAPFLFFDFANLFVQEALPGQKEHLALRGTGFGIRGGCLGKSLEYDAAWGFALSSTDNTDFGDSRLHFRMKYLF
ncbi:MAG: ShlB/FhaC/HecB family hemolysin secretion/activation protein [Syntrophobacteraceae bacterium]